MRARYIRVSTIKQNEERQLARQHPNEMIFIDKISGAVPFEKRPQAIMLLAAIKKGEINFISVSSIDRLGRSTLDVLQTIDFLTKSMIILKVDNLGLESLVNGKESPTFKLIVSVLSNISEMEREAHLSRVLEGVANAKLKKNIYLGRQKGTFETREVILKKYPLVVNYLNKKKGTTYKEIAKLCDVSKNTVVKVKKVLEAA